MPKVQQYNRQVQDQAAPNVQFNNNAPIEAFGGGRAAQEAGAVRELAGVASQIAIKAREDADDVAFAEQAEKLKRARIDLEMNPERGLLNRRGKDAFNLGQESEESWEKASSEILASAPNDRVRERLSRAKAVEGLSMYERVQSHVSREMRTHDAETTKALTETAVNDAILNKGDPDAVYTNLEIAKNTIVKFAARDGKDSAWINRAVSETTSKAHSAMINQYLDSGDDKAAKAHFERFKSDITDSDTLGQIQKNLEIGSHLGEVTRVADEITMKTNDMKSAMVMLQDITDPKIRKDAQSMVFQTMELKRRAEVDRSERQMDGHLRQLETSRGVYNLPPSALSSMKTDHIKAFEARKEQLVSGRDAAPNGPVYYDLRLMAADPAKSNDFKELYLPSYAALMPPSELSKMIELQAEMREGKSGKSSKELGQFRTQMEAINSVLTANKIDVTPKPGSDDAALLEKLRTQVEQESVRYADENNKAPSNEMIRDWAEAYMVEIVTGRKWMFFDEKKRKIEAMVRYKDIPSEHKEAIRRSLQTNKIPYSQQAVEQAYLKMIEASGKK